MRSILIRNVLFKAVCFTALSILLEANTVFAQTSNSLLLTVNNPTPSHGEKVVFTMQPIQILGQLTGVSLICKGTNIDLMDNEPPYEWSSSVQETFEGEMEFSLLALTTKGMLLKSNTKKSR
jgi:hypothetical protein